MTLATPEQAELYQLLLEDKVYFKTVEFAKGLVAAKSPSPKQMYWVNKIVADTLAYQARSATSALAPAPAVQKVDISKVMVMFANAKQHLKRPKITLLMGAKDAAGSPILAQSRKVRFSLDLNRGRLYMNGDVYGWVDVNTQELVLRGRGRDNEADLKSLLDEFTTNPVKVAVLHGKLTGNCCFCQLPLSDPRSLHQGYGPVCADHWHLPWGENSKFSAEVDWVAGDKPKMAAAK